MTGKGNKARHVRCPWCQRQPVQLKRGRIQSHLSPGGVKCVGSGRVYPETLA